MKSGCSLRVRHYVVPSPIQFKEEISQPGEIEVPCACGTEKLTMRQWGRMGGLFTYAKSVHGHTLSQCGPVIGHSDDPYDPQE